MLATYGGWRPTAAAGLRRLPAYGGCRPTAGKKLGNLPAVKSEVTSKVKGFVTTKTNCSNQNKWAYISAFVE
jgi:hypothetical protein